MIDVWYAVKKNNKLLQEEGKKVYWFRRTT